LRTACIAGVLSSSKFSEQDENEKTAVRINKNLMYSFIE
jgi:hypothetical protein